MSAMRQDPSHGAVPVPKAQSATAVGQTTTPQRRGTLSIVVPARNEAESLPRLVAEILEGFRPLRDRGTAGPNPLEAFEIVIVDDGSSDASVGVLRELRSTCPELRPLALARNFGQSAALAAGFHAARGDWLAVLDADLQNPPAELARLWDALPGHDVVLGWRIKREDVWSKRLISRFANRARNAVLGQSIKDTGCAVRIFPRDVALRLPWFHGAHRFFGPLLAREGCRVLQAPVAHRPRPHGTSHYNLWNRSINVIVDLLGVAWLMRRPARYELAANPTATSLPEERATPARRA